MTFVMLNPSTLSIGDPKTGIHLKRKGVPLVWLLCCNYLREITAVLESCFLKDIYTGIVVEQVHIKG